MRNTSSRRRFLAAGAALPAAAFANPGAGAAAATPPLEFRQLGKTGLKVTSLSFGCMTASDPAVLARAADIGIIHFDSARGYQGGNNERMVGTALKGKRKQLVLSSKSIGKTKKDIQADLETSLRELGTDYLDIWYLHNRSTPAEVPDELFEYQQEAKKAGKIRFAGVSFHANMPDMLTWVTKHGQTDVALVAYNFLMKPDVTQAIEATRKAGVGVVAMKVLAGGIGRVTQGDRLWGADQSATLGKLKQPGAMTAAIRWALKNRSVDTAIVCMADFDQLDENLQASKPWGPADEKVLAAHAETIRPLYCSMCGSCGGTCERGVPVRDVLRILTYVEGYKEFPMARERYLELPERARNIRCADCSSCTVACPNGVRVRDRVMRAQEILA